MDGNNEEVSGKHLTVDELLKTRGIYTRVWNEYTQVSRVLPTKGEKFFEPNGSWLENKQIETNLQTTKDLLKLERVNRTSAMASAEWIPEEKRAKVVKKSGVDWNNYGHTLNSITYLIPEEAMLLLETNHLELTYGGISLSIQQAYELLILSDDSDCSLNEYRVYSQLARLGYRLQKFYYSKTTSEKLEESSQLKKRAIINPENGNWMENISENSSSRNFDLAKSNEDKSSVTEIINSIIDKIEIKENELDCRMKTEENSNLQNNGSSEIDLNNDKTREQTKDNSKERSKPRLEILSEETVIDPVKLMISSSRSLDTDSDRKCIRPGSRIQRNVKLLPKRTDKNISFSSHQTQNGTKSSDQTSDKRKSEIADLKEVKKSKHEIIELSDDDIEEIPVAMTRMEMLNCFPNIASKDSITQIIPKNYIPSTIKLQKNFYEYDRVQLGRMHSGRSTDSDVSEMTENNGKHSHGTDSMELSLHSNSRSTVSTHVYQRSRPSSSALWRDNQIWQNDYHQSFTQNGQGNYFYSNRFSNSQCSRGGCTSNNFIQQKMMASCSAGTNCYRPNFVPNRWPLFYLNFYRNFAMTTFSSRASSMMYNTTNFYQQHTRDNIIYGKFNIKYSNFSRFSGPQGFFPPRVPVSTVGQYSQAKKMLQLKAKLSDQSNDYENDEISFFKISATSWSDLKKKWKEAKTITIEDEDDKMDCSEVEILDQKIQPLINVKNVKTFTEVYEKLNIIKSAQEKTVRKKKGDYKISYKVYSNTQNYKKSNPGSPMFHLVITNIGKNFPQPIELNRLQQDGEGSAIIFAFVSEATISYMQAGIVSLPNLSDSK